MDGACLSAQQRRRPNPDQIIFPFLDPPVMTERHNTNRDDLGNWNIWLYLFELSSIVILIIWPWIFYLVVAAKHGGLAMNPQTGAIVNKHPTETTWVVTNLSNILAMLVSYFFSSAARTLAIKWLGSRESNIRTLSFISAAKSPSQALPWIYSNRSWILANAQGLQCGLALVMYFALLLLVLSGFNALLAPHPITRTSGLTGKELDFTSSDPDCVYWFENNAPDPTACNWQQYGNSSFTTCAAENQLVDVLESGRSNILSSVPGSNNTVTFNQLGGVRFSGPIRGVLPGGPNGIPVLNHISLSPLTDEILDAALSYQYNASLQGFTSNISCIYDSESPITFVNSTTNPGVRGIIGTCPPGHDILGHLEYPSFLLSSSLNFLGYYACNASSTGSGGSYNLYFRGDGNYINPIGNVTCQLSSARHATYDVTYNSQPGLFSAHPSSSSSSNNQSRLLIDSAVKAVGDLVWSAQWLQLNSVAESVITFGIKDFGVPPYAHAVQNLRIIEAMIQGVLEYEVTYGRLIYAIYNSGSENAHNNVTALPKCLRDITGKVTYNIIGWHMAWRNVVFLLPMTIVNLTSLCMLLAAALYVGERRKLPRFDPSNPTSVLIAASRGKVHIDLPQPDDPEDILVSEIPIEYVQENGVSKLRRRGAMVPGMDGQSGDVVRDGTQERPLSPSTETYELTETHS
ncbi:hypothetical protein JAAARDRAFT_161814 [Jaapia argillacea MUCL 33604]|uniref:Uncharacterized protein n=1 Tax=Jaapia argillacea MUCL 33604 TaxID=933084 RepID=A0A067PEV0_9AGAM|nr:hypothetical protein JAAARDRAFT_161814 [Jaapia argillacea MUCL 33604]